jgi:hypothetical protein
MQSLSTQKNVMKLVVIGFSKPKKQNLISNAIMWVIRSKFSHVYLSFYSKSLNRKLIYQGNKRGVHFLSKDRFIKDNEVVDFVTLNLTPSQYTKALQSCVDNCGEQYGFWQLIGLGIVICLKRLGISVNNPFHEGFICSEIVAKILIDSGYLQEKDFKKDIQDLTPKDLYELLKLKFY